MIDGPSGRTHHVRVISLLKCYYHFKCGHFLRLSNELDYVVIVLLNTQLQPNLGTAQPSLTITCGFVSLSGSWSFQSGPAELACWVVQLKCEIKAICDQMCYTKCSPSQLVILLAALILENSLWSKQDWWLTTQAHGGCDDDGRSELNRPRLVFVN